MITREKFDEIFETTESNWEGDNALTGLLIISKYIKDTVLVAAEHDCIYSVGVDELIAAGITEEDVTTLRLNNWGGEDDTLYCFV